MSKALKPGSTIGILGGGQLGRMLCSAAAKLGFKTHIFTPENNPPAASLADVVTCAAYEDEAAITAFARQVDVVTYEFENIPLNTAQLVHLTDTPLRPGVKPLEISQDRLTEKRFLKDLDIEPAPFMPVASEAALGMAVKVTGLPAILKTRRFGYDGKGQAVIHDEAEAETALLEMAGQPSILEGFVPFEREISVIAARGLDGVSAIYDCPHNHHTDGILRSSTVPCGVADHIVREAQEAAEKVLKALDYIGVIAIEFFVLKDGSLRVNEFAPRVHNSGHWTLEACACSQFEQHIRAIAGWPLGATSRHSDCVMENLIGADIDKWPDIAAESKAVLTLYGKHETRPGRKMGHVTRLQ